MTKKYTLVSDFQRMQLIHLIHKEGLLISEAAKIAAVNYNAAKVINNVYKREGRVNKKITRPRKSKYEE